MATQSRPPAAQRGSLFGVVITFRRYRLSRVRHEKPFNKTKRGAQRRAERHFKMEQQGLTWSNDAQANIS